MKFTMRAQRLPRAMLAGTLVALLVAATGARSFGGTSSLMLVCVTVASAAEAPDRAGLLRP